MANKHKSLVHRVSPSSFLKKKKKGTSKAPIVKTKVTPPTVSVIYDAIPVKHNTFNPEIHPTIFAYICGCFCREQPNETAGFFNWNEEENLIDWAWSDPDDNKQSSGGVEYGTAKMRIAWGEDGIPTGQWHTHPNLNTFWSATDKEDQLKFVNELIKVNPTGSFCFVVLDQLDWKAARLVWNDGTVSHRETGVVHINGVPLKGVVKSYTYQTYALPSYGTAKPNATKVHKVSDDDKHIVGPRYNAYYNDLFDIFFIPKYDWVSLHETIETFYPEMYYEILYEEISWHWLRKDFDQKFFGPDNSYGGIGL